jgi:hypothetical protein
MIQTVFEAGALSMLFVQGLKLLIGKIKKNPEFGFTPIVYQVGVPVLNAVMPFAMCFVLGVGCSEPILGLGVQGVLQYVARVAIGALVSFMSYDMGVKPLITYARSFNNPPMS